MMVLQCDRCGTEFKRDTSRNAVEVKLCNFPIRDDRVDVDLCHDCQTEVLSIIKYGENGKTNEGFKRLYERWKK